MFDLNQKANRGEVVVGWYTTGSKVRTSPPNLSSHNPPPPNPFTGSPCRYSLANFLKFK
jgi:hypothetical protein